MASDESTQTAGLAAPGAVVRQNCSPKAPLLRVLACEACGRSFQAVKPTAVVCSGRCRALRSKARREALVAAEAIHRYLSDRAVKAAATRKARRQVAQVPLPLETNAKSDAKL